MSFSIPDEYDGHVQPQDGELPDTVYHVAPASARELIAEEGLSVHAERTHNVGGGWHSDDEDDEFIYEDMGEGPVATEWRPHAVFVWPTLEQAVRYCQDGMDIYEIDVESVYGEFLRDPSVAMNWDYVDDDHRAYMVDHVPTSAIERMPSPEVTALRAAREAQLSQMVAQRGKRPVLSDNSLPEPAQAAQPGPGQTDLGL
jgi:hypothetical protein